MFIYGLYILFCSWTEDEDNPPSSSVALFKPDHFTEITRSMSLQAQDLFKKQILKQTSPQSKRGYNRDKNYKIVLSISLSRKCFSVGNHQSIIIKKISKKTFERLHASLMSKSLEPRYHKHFIIFRNCSGIQKSKRSNWLFSLSVWNCLVFVVVIYVF